MKILKLDNYQKGRQLVISIFDSGIIFIDIYDDTHKEGTIILTKENADKLRAFLKE